MAARASIPHPDLRAALFDYVEVFYNRARHQAGLGHRSPADYETALNAA